MSSSRLPEGEYPFATIRLPLAEMVMVEAPREMETLFRRTAELNGLTIVRDEIVELRCESHDRPDATFVIWWPSNSDRIHVLVPRRSASNLA